jgi:HEPN domain-containing protein
MTAEEKIQYWINLSNNDLKVANTLLKGKHYLYTGFMCHQVIEKIFKAYYIKLKAEIPPYTHDLRYIAIVADFWKDLSDVQQLQVIELLPLQIEARYPEYKNRIAQSLSEGKCSQLIEQVKLLQQWIIKQILLKK